MEKNFTPLDVKKTEEKTKLYKKKTKNINTILLLMATLTAIVLAIMLFILIQKKNKNSPQTKIITSIKII